jgi:hypothetical protein
VKLILAIVVLVILAASAYADSKWRRWMASRRAEHRDRE